MMPFLRQRLFAPLFARREGLPYPQHLTPLKHELEVIADPESRERMQIERTAAIIEHAYTHSAFFRTFYDEHGFQPPLFKDLRDLARVPVLEKRFITGQQERILVPRFEGGALVPTATGGTTGNSFAFWYDRDCYARRHALTILADEAYGWHVGDPVAYVWNAQQDLPKTRSTWKRRVRTWLTGRCLYVDASHITEELLAYWIEQLAGQRIEILYGYAHTLCAIGEYCEAEGIELPRVRLVVSTAEPLFEAGRRLLERVFSCPVRDRYASREHGPMAQEAQDGSLRYFANSILMETEAEPGEAGDILVTDFWNRAFPFIRYRIGDTCQLDPGAERAYGLPRFGRLTGRQTDFLIGTDGARISGMAFHEAFANPTTGNYGTDDFLAVQFVQTAPGVIRVRCVPGLTYDRDRVAASLNHLVHDLLGESMAVEIEEVSEIPRTASGKYRFTVNAASREHS
jgi:phenylacetate-CoA ligase